MWQNGGMESLSLELSVVVGTLWRTGMSAATNDGRVDSAEVLLARAAVAGEPWAQREVWEQYAPMVKGVLRRALGPEHDFDDLLQDVFLRVFHRVSGLRDPNALRSFVYSVTIRVVRWEIRRAQSRRRRQAADLQSTAMPPRSSRSIPRRASFWNACRRSSTGCPRRNERSSSCATSRDRASRRSLRVWTSRAAPPNAGSSAAFAASRQGWIEMAGSPLC